ESENLMDEFVSQDESSDEEALETAENQINVLNQISDESFEELNELLSFIQRDDVKEETYESDEMYQGN
ncbi:MAG: hypothetical protein ACFCAD_09715, partial [Pleurocapsa sp.]